MSSSEADRFFGGAPGLSYPRPNDQGQYTDVSLRGVIRGGVIVDEPQVVPVTEMGTGKPRTWDDGTPREQLVVTLRCDGSRGGARDERNPQNPHDDGRRRLYIKSYLVPAVRQALKDAGAPGLRVGGELYVCWTGEEPPKRAGNAWARTWAAKYIPPTTALPQDGAAARAPSAAGASNPFAGTQQTPVPTPAEPAPQGSSADPWGAATPPPRQPAPAVNPWA